MGDSEQDIHDRHLAEDNEDNGNRNKPQKVKAAAKTSQAVRDAHFQEDGVKADGTVPGTKGATE